MSFLAFILNVLWVVFGGLWMALAWVIAAALMAITIIGLPWTPAVFRTAGFSYWPFGRTVVARDSGASSLLLNIVWFVVAGWWLALHHIVLAVGLAVTIIGLPFAWQHLKMAALALAPVGKVVI